MRRHPHRAMPERTMPVAALLAALLLVPTLAVAQGLTVGLVRHEEGASEGYTLFTPLFSTTTYLIDIGGFLVRTWESDYRPGNAVYLLENGNLLRTGSLQNPWFDGGGSGGIVEERTWEGSLLWQYTYSSSQHLQHHDVERLPNGNVLILAWEERTQAEAIAAGRNPALISQGELWPDHLIEVEPVGATGGVVVWEWHVWDHLIQDHDPSKENYGVVADHPELIDLNFVRSGPGGGGADWNHVNSVAYNEEFDQIVLSVHNFSEVWIIDHSTTTEESSGHSGGTYGKGGDLLYRWGNPQTYDAGGSGDQKFFMQHDARWVPAGYPGEGNLTVFNNGGGRPGGNASSVDEFVPPVDDSGFYTHVPGEPYGPDEQLWVYMADDPTEFYASNISGAHRLPNGNTLICAGPQGTFFEVTAEMDTVWVYVSPLTVDGPLEQGDPPPSGGRNVFRSERYSPEFPGFEGKDLTPGDPIELYPNGVDGSSGEVQSRITLDPVRPNPFNPRATISFELHEAAHVRLSVHDVLGREIAELVDGFREAGPHTAVWGGTDDLGHALGSGVYFLRLEAAGAVETRSMTLLK